MAKRKASRAAVRGREPEGKGPEAAKTAARAPRREPSTGPGADRALARKVGEEKAQRMGAEPEGVSANLGSIAGRAEASQRVQRVGTPGVHRAVARQAAGPQQPKDKLTSPGVAGVAEPDMPYRGGFSIGSGASGEVVEGIQLLLLALDPAALPEFGADGRYGDETRAAVERFQKKHRAPGGKQEVLAVDGVVGPKTLQRMKMALLAAQPKQGRANEGRYVNPEFPGFIEVGGRTGATSKGGAGKQGASSTKHVADNKGVGPDGSAKTAGKKTGDGPSAYLNFHKEGILYPFVQSGGFKTGFDFMNPSSWDAYRLREEVSEPQVAATSAGETNDYSTFYVNEGITEKNFVNLMLGRFVTGIGPENFVFPLNGKVSNEMRETPIVQNALMKWYAENSAAVLSRDPVKAKPEGSTFDFLGQASLLLEKWGIQNIPQFVGSATVTIEFHVSDDLTVRDDQLLVTIRNVTSATSGDILKHFKILGTAPSFPKDPGKTGLQPYTNISQTFQFTMPVDRKKAQMMKELPPSFFGR